MSPIKKPGKNILIVDDDQVTLMLLSQILENSGYGITQARCGEDALNIVMMSEPDLALLDVNMPGMSGLDLAKRLQIETDVPFMFLSASTDHDIIKQGISYGAVGYLVKPVDTVNLIPTLEASLARASEIKQLRKSELSLTSALASGRETSMAVGVLMAKFQTDRHAAFDALRAHARANRKTISDVANELLLAEETINQFKKIF
ncbi:ANTAR domain-containing response regulator [Undibacterium sp. Xuan67W]|uniref:ANTAR domain-containing response regulator n=1 Tax=Undibacterium sp. Xuan67W TaxID=3413057 RepID=UPI003BF3D1F2